MSNEFKIEIISPKQNVYSGKTEEAVLPCFEGQITVLKNHIPLITFLRPGIIAIGKNEKFYTEDGTVEFSENNLLILSSTAKDVNNIKTEEAQKMIANAKQAILKNDIKDKDKYILSYKIDTLQEITQ